VRFLDVFVSGIGLLLLSPLLAAIAVAIKIFSPGPVCYRAMRAGKDGTPFRLYKLRTMVPGAEQSGPGITVAGDRRITRIGRFLRGMKLDELPQLLNVLKGDMSLVGPRPEDPRYLAFYTAEQRRLLRVRPGITSPASLYYRREAALLSESDWERVYVSEILPHKLEVELEYLAHRSLWTDLMLIARTVWVVITD
jgi:lipopolysaccharide/colanic/teichoic acid biosynthesis glycosyltransferase